MADVTWLPTEEGTHAVVMGDLVTLCGEPGFLRSTTPEPGPNVCPKCRQLIEDMAKAIATLPPERRHGSHNTYDDGCRCADCTSAAAAHQSARAARRQAESLPGAHHRGMVWTGSELEIAARRDLTARQAAEMLGRTVAAVLWARKKLRRDPKFSRLAGVDDHV